MIRQRSAFTLVELLTVIAILALLISILLPTLSKARQQAKASACLSTIKGIGTGVTIYLNENRDHFFPVRLYKTRPTDEEDYFNEFKRLKPRWQWFIQTDSGPVIDPKPFERLRRPWGDLDLYSVGQLGTKMTIDVFTCPSLSDPEFDDDVRNGAYGYNYQYLGNTRTDTNEDRWDNFAVGLHRIKSPARTIIIADSRGAGRKHGYHSYTLDPPRLGLEVNAQKFGPSDRDITSDTNQVYKYSPAEARHNDRANVLFIDSHAESMSHKEMGYQLNDGKPPFNPSIKGVPSTVPLGLSHPYEGPYESNNQLWNGLGVDKIAQEANPITPGL